MIAYKNLNPFLKRLNDQLLELGQNRVWLHRQTGIKLSTINSWISNNRYPRVDHAYRIAKELKVTVEYLLLDHYNDSTDQAHELAHLLKDTPCKINLIPFNPFPGNDYGKPSNSRVDRFNKVLMEYGYTVIVRNAR